MAKVLTEDERSSLMLKPVLEEKVVEYDFREYPGGPIIEHRRERLLFVRRPFYHDEIEREERRESCKKS